MTYIILSEKKWNETMPEHLQSKTGGKWILVKDRNNFNLKNLKKIRPRKIFIPHWSYVIPEEIFETFECIVFHMTDLPYGRGGSPLQNLILRGHKKTVISAIRVVKKLDGGDIYLKKPLSLAGSAEEIFHRASLIIEEMIVEIIQKKSFPRLQTGIPVYFNRRKPGESDMSGLVTTDKVYDYIRMLDAEGYPRAFLETRNLRFEFSNAKPNDDNSVTAWVRITAK